MEGLKVVGVHNGRTKLVTLSPQSSDGIRSAPRGRERRNRHRR
jgi:hypothetical protein